LRNRRQKVCIKSKQSSRKEVWSGVSQESVLGFSFFKIFIHDLEDHTSGNVFKFADHIKIFRQVSDVHDNICMQIDLDKLVAWADKWQMQFNVSKCKVMHVPVGQNSIFSYSTKNNGLRIVETNKDQTLSVYSNVCMLII